MLKLRLNYDGQCSNHVSTMFRPCLNHGNHFFRRRKNFLPSSSATPGSQRPRGRQRLTCPCCPAPNLNPTSWGSRDAATRLICSCCGVSGGRTRQRRRQRGPNPHWTPPILLPAGAGPPPLSLPAAGLGATGATSLALLLGVDNGPLLVHLARARRRRGRGELGEDARKRHGEHAADLNGIAARRAHH